MGQGSESYIHPCRRNSNCHMCRCSDAGSRRYHLLCTHLHHSVQNQEIQQGQLHQVVQVDLEVRVILFHHGQVVQLVQAFQVLHHDLGFQELQVVQRVQKILLHQLVQQGQGIQGHQVNPSFQKAQGVQ